MNRFGLKTTNLFKKKLEVYPYIRKIYMGTHVQKYFVLKF